MVFVTVDVRKAQGITSVVDTTLVSETVVPRITRSYGIQEYYYYDFVQTKLRTTLTYIHLKLNIHIHIHIYKQLDDDSEDMAFERSRTYAYRHARVIITR